MNWTTMTSSFPEIVEEAIFRGNVEHVMASAEEFTAQSRCDVSDLVTVTEIWYRIRRPLTILLDIIALKIAHSRQYHDKVPNGLG